LKVLDFSDKGQHPYFTVWGFRFWVESRVYMGSEFRVCGLRFRVEGSNFYF